MQKCAVNGYRKELTITTYSLTTSEQLDWKHKSENSILVCYACVETLHDYTTDTNDDMTTMTVFHTEHINTNTWVRLVLFILCQRIVIHCTCSAWLKSELCPSFHSHPHALMMCVVLPRHWSLHSLHPLPLAPPVALLPLLHPLEVRRQPAHSAQRQYGLHWWDLLPHRSWAQRLRLQGDFCRVLHRAPDLAAVPLRQRVSRGRRVRWHRTRRYALRSSPGHSHHSLREDLSVSLSSSVSERTERPVGERAGRPAECRSQDAQIKILLERQKKRILAECQAEIIRNEFQAEEVQQRDQQLLHGQLLQQNLEFREAHQKSLSKMKELKKFQSSTFDTIARRRLGEDQDTILEFSGRIQDLQYEINCVSDSKEFQDAESIRSGNSHVTSRPVSFPPHPIPEGMLNRFFGVPSRREGPPSIWDTHGTSGNVFCKSRCVFINTLSSRIESMEFIDRGAAPFIHSGKEWKANTGSRSPVWTVSQKFSHLQWTRLFKELWGRPTTIADFGSSFRQIPHTSNVCLFEDKIQDWGMYLFTISYGSYAMDQRSGDGWFSGWFKIFIINKRCSNAKILKYLMRGLLQRWTKSSIILTSEEESVWRNKRPRSRAVSFEASRLLIWSTKKWWYSGIRLKVGRISIVFDENPTKWNFGRIVQIKNTRIWETQDRIGIVWPGDSSEEVRTWLSQIEKDGEKTYRARRTK